MLPKQEQNIKILSYLLLGYTGVGKSSILNMFVENKFQSFNTTIGIDKKEKRVNTSNGQIVKLVINDSAGQPHFFTLTAKQYKKYDAIFIVYDMIDRDTLKCAEENYYKEVKQNLQKQSKCQLIFVANKKDLTKDQQYNSLKCKDFAIKNNLQYFQISAKCEQEVNQMFMKITQKLIAKKQQVIVKNQKQQQKKVEQIIQNKNQNDLNINKQSVISQNQDLVKKCQNNSKEKKDQDCLKCFKCSII